MSKTRVCPRRVVLVVWLLALAAPPGCGLGVNPSQPPVPPGVAPTPQATLCDDPLATEETFCLPAERIAAALADGPLEILRAESTDVGMSSPLRLLVRAREPHSGAPLVFEVKWKAAPPDGDALNNSPRRELAAWLLQTLLLEPDEYVVPPTVARCIPEEHHDRFVRGAEPQFEGTDCVLGVLSYWLPNVDRLDGLDARRWEHDLAWRDAVARANVLAYLAAVGDAHSDNLLDSTDPLHPRAFVVDAGLAFGSIENPLSAFWAVDWGDLVVPAVPSDLVQRLRLLTRSDLSRLSVVAQLERRGDRLVPVPETRFPGEWFDGFEWSEGTLRLGLTEDEIDAVWERLRAVLRAVDEGELRVFRPPGPRESAHAGRDPGAAPPDVVPATAPAGAPARREEPGPEAP